MPVFVTQKQTFILDAQCFKFGLLHRPNRAVRACGEVYDQEMSPNVICGKIRSDNKLTDQLIAHLIKEVYHHGEQQYNTQYLDDFVINPR